MERSHNLFHLKPYSQTALVESHQIPKSKCCNSNPSKKTPRLCLQPALTDGRKLVCKTKHIGLYCPLYKQETVTGHFLQNGIFETSGKTPPSIPTIIRLCQTGVTSREVDQKDPIWNSTMVKKKMIISILQTKL